MLVTHDDQNVFKCTKCGFKTSGVILPDSTKDRRWCPDCNSPLVHCNHCLKFTSGTIVGSIMCTHCSKFPLVASDGSSEICCDSCKKVVKPEASVI